MTVTHTCVILNFDLKTLSEICNSFFSCYYLKLKLNIFHILKLNQYFPFFPGRVSDDPQEEGDHFHRLQGHNHRLGTQEDD